MARCVDLGSPWSGIIYRFTSLKYATRGDLLSGVGSKKCGGRWNPMRSFRAVYGSATAETALEESFAHHCHYGIPIHSALPRVMVAVRVELSNILDLTAGNVRRHLGISTARMVAEDWQSEQDRGREALTQAIGRMAFEAGLEGLLVPSAAVSNGQSQVLFPDNLAPGSLLKIVNARQLPK
jgi:RES domain-containing protein